MKKEEIISIIDFFDEIHGINDNNIILGDFNFVENDIDKGKKMDNKDKMICPIWENFKFKNAIVDPYRVRYPKRRQFSFVAPTGKSRGDRIYTSDHLQQLIVSMTYRHTHFNSAHKIMSVDIAYEQDIGPGYWKLNSSILKDEQYVAKIENLHEEIQNLRIRDPLEKFDLFFMATRGITKNYTKIKAKIKSELKQICL